MALPPRASRTEKKPLALPASPRPSPVLSPRSPCQIAYLAAPPPSSGEASRRGGGKGASGVA
eukprot:15000575-Alexandrium_andersonii.AAC.1